MKHLCAILAAVAVATAAFAGTDAASSESRIGNGLAATPETIYDINNVQRKPEFPGGETAMFQWLGEHIIYPELAANEGVNGRVVVLFTISKTGEVKNAKVVRGKHPALDKEAVRLVQSMPRWTPGYNNGEPVEVTYTIPITFKLNK